MYQTVIDAVLAYEEKKPNQLAVAFKKEQLTYCELCQRLRGTAEVLNCHWDIDKGDMVALPGVSSLDYVVAYLAIQSLGAVPVLMDKSQKDGGSAVAKYIKPKLMLTAGEISNSLVPSIPLKTVCEEGIRVVETTRGFSKRSSENGDLAEIIFTSGTTGNPKGVMLSVGNIYAISNHMYSGIGIREDDVILIPLPLNHSLGMRSLRTALLIGATVVLQDGFTFAKEIERNLDIYHCTGLVCTPAPMELIFRQMQDQFSKIMGRFRYIEIGAGSLSQDMKGKLLQSLPNTALVNTWGSSETGGVIFLRLSEHPDKIASIGKPIEGVDFATVDENGNFCLAADSKKAARMALRGPMQMIGYYHMPEETEKTLVNGWLYTNDLVYQDKDGYIYMLGRADDIINVGGEKVSPVEVEDMAQTFEKVQSCACIGVKDPDGILGEVPVLFVVPVQDEYNENELERYLSAKLEKYKLPHRYIIIEQLPRNKMDKLDRLALRQIWADKGDKSLIK